MAKDGTNRGGRRVRAGDKPAPAAEKKQKGLPVKIISNDIPVLDTAELEAVDLPEGAVLNGTDMPKPSDYLSARQKNGVPLGADDIYRETWLWLKQRNCENLVNKYLVADHHEGIISKEDFDVVATLIERHAVEKNVTKGSHKYQLRYCFSGKIVCGECGATLKHRTHRIGGETYEA